MFRRSRAFTLIELLVVVAIIAVLLAIALPAIDRAIYAAEQAGCSASLKSIAGGVQTYAVGHRRAYPYRATINRSTNKVPNIIAIEPNIVGSGFDDRPYLKDHVELKALRDPFLSEVDLGPDANDDGVQVFSNYALWFGMYYKGGGGLTRMGGRLTFKGQSFRILASDWDAFQVNSAEKVHAGHADADGVMTELVQQNVGGKTRAMWYSNLVAERGPIDTNYASDDGSVERYDGVTYDETAPGGDERMVKVPFRADDTDTEFNWIHLPRN